MNMTPSRGGTCPCHAPGSRVGPRMTQRLLIGATFSLSSLPRLVQHDVVKLHPRKMHGHEDKNGLSWATRRHPSELRAPSGRAICRMPGPSICPSQGGGGTACTACRIILAPLDMPEQSSQHTNDAGGELGKREKTSWMGIWQPPLIASQLTIDAFGGVATGRRMEKKKSTSPVVCCLILHPTRPSKTKNEDPTDLSGRLVPGRCLGTCEGIFAFNPFARERFR